MGDHSPRSPWWSHIFVFFLSAFFFLSLFLTVLAPLPLLLLYETRGRKLTLAAAISNTLIVALMRDPMSAAFFLIFVVTPALSISELFRRKVSVEKTAVGALSAMIACAGIFVAGYWGLYHLNLLVLIQEQLSSFIDYLGQSISAHSGAVPGTLDPVDLEEWKHGFLIEEVPSGIAIFALLMIWANMTILLRLNVGQIRTRLGLEDGYIKKWKAPYFLVWPTILTGFLLIVNLGVASSIAINVFKFLMTVYVIQGLSILSHLFDLWGMKGFLRVTGFFLSLFFLFPLVLSLGFFDLWFDFRSKFKAI